jgi:hypothetical protein
MAGRLAWMRRATSAPLIPRPGKIDQHEVNFWHAIEHLECRAAAAGLKHPIAALAQHGTGKIAHRIVVINNKYVRRQQFGLSYQPAGWHGPLAASTAACGR